MVHNIIEHDSESRFLLIAQYVEYHYTLVIGLPLDYPSNGVRVFYATRPRRMCRVSLGNPSNARLRLSSFVCTCVSVLGE